MIALQKNLGAAADAHHVVADFVEAGGGVSGAEEREDGGDEDEGMREFAAQRPTSRKRGEKWGTRRIGVRVCHRLLGSRSQVLGLRP